MSFTKDIKQEVSHKELSKDEAKAELSELIQLTSSLSISHSGLAMVSVTKMRLFQEQSINYAKNYMRLKLHRALKEE